MKIPPSYRLTKKITVLLNAIEANRVAIDKVNLPLDVENSLRRRSILHSALFSARIEGNRLGEEDILSYSFKSRRDRSQIEVNNLRQANAFVLQNFKDNKRFSNKNILKLHQLAMKHILASEYLGTFRKGHEGVFDSSGIAIYHAPPPTQINGLMEDLVKYLNSKTEKLIPVKAVLSHLILENIHPFADGSGRVGRLLQLAILSNYGYAMRGFANTEEIIDKNRQLYYQAIEDSRSVDSTFFVELMLRFLADSSAAALKRVEQQSDSVNNLISLTPRRQELVEIIQDHKIVSLDFLCRRFITVDPRLLRYDLKYLMDNGYVSKIGKTRGALYTINLK